MPTATSEWSGVLMHDVVEDLVVVVEPQFAVGALVGRVIHGMIVRFLACGR
jgi:hypothetical protein